VTAAPPSEPATDGVERFQLYSALVEHRPGEQMTFSAARVSNSAWYDLPLFAGHPVAAEVATVMTIGLIGVVLEATLGWVHPDAPLWQHLGLWGALAVIALHVLSREDQEVVRFGPPSLVERKRRFGRWRETLLRFPLEGTHVHAAIEASSWEEGCLGFIIELRSGGESRRLLTADAFHRRTVRKIAQRLAEGLGVPLEDQLDDPEHILVMSPPHGSLAPTPPEDQLLTGPRSWWLLAGSLWLGAAMMVGLVFIVLLDSNPDSSALIAIASLGVLAVLALPFVTFWIHPDLGFEVQKLDPERQTLTLGAPLQRFPWRREFRLDPADTHLVVAFRQGHRGMPVLRVYWSLGAEIVPLAIKREFMGHPPKIYRDHFQRLGNEREWAFRCDRVHQIADLCGLEIEIVGRAAMERYRHLQRELEEKQDG
jgi:hypothetical protein